VLDKLFARWLFDYFRLKRTFWPTGKVLDVCWDKNHDNNFFGALGRSGNDNFYLLYIKIILYIYIQFKKIM
jgi:hypothetical protein